MIVAAKKHMAIAGTPVRGEVPDERFKGLGADGGSQRRQGSAGSPGGIWIKPLIWVLVLLSFPALMWPSPVPGALAAVEFESGNFQEASKRLENALRKHPDDASLQLLLARCYYELKDWNRAAAHAESAEKLEPQNAEAHLALGEIYGQMADQQRSVALAIKTRKELERAVALDPSNVNARRDLMEFYLDAPWLLGGGKSKAKKQADAIATINPVAGALARAHYDEKTGDVPAAENEARQAINFKPAQIGAYLEAADFFASRQDVAGVKAAVDAAHKLNPSDPRLTYYHAVADILQGSNLNGAERALKTYAATAPGRSSYPSRASALSWLGDLYERLGKPQLAVQQYHAALQLDPGLTAASEGLDRLNKQ